MSTLPLQFLILSVAGWVTRSQESKVRYLMAENGVLREQVGSAARSRAVMVLASDDDAAQRALDGVWCQNSLYQNRGDSDILQQVQRRL